mmetsp:Transcript_133036/g.323355  ORF Transcript_133036/g.323355 Transcript_133036/m.323355 type:complete len:251 (-) Transcript_133036:45-797(-)
MFVDAQPLGSSLKTLISGCRLCGPHQSINFIHVNSGTFSPSSRSRNRVGPMPLEAGGRDLTSRCSSRTRSKSWNAPRCWSDRAQSGSTSATLADIRCTALGSKANSSTCLSMGSSAQAPLKEAARTSSIRIASAPWSVHCRQGREYTLRMALKKRFNSRCSSAASRPSSGSTWKPCCARATPQGACSKQPEAFTMQLRAATPVDSKRQSEVPSVNWAIEPRSPSRSKARPEKSLAAMLDLTRKCPSKRER